MDGVSKVSFNFLYTLWVYRSCICITYKYSQKLSPAFLWVSKFDVKLGSGGKIFKVTFLNDFLKVMPKVRFQKQLRQRAFFFKI